MSYQGEVAIGDRFYVTEAESHGSEAEVVGLHADSPWGIKVRFADSCTWWVNRERLVPVAPSPAPGATT